MIGFELALIGAGIDYIPNYLHYSKHDANYLYQLFCTCRQQFIQATADEYCIVNTNTKKLHTRNCRYVRNMPLEKILMKPKRLNWTYIRKSETSSKKDKSKILKQLPLTEKNIDIICRHFQVSYSVSNAAVFICTAYSRWIIYLNHDAVTELLLWSPPIYKKSWWQHAKKNDEKKQIRKIAWSGWNRTTVKKQHWRSCWRIEGS